jgi:microspherule protein 1
VELRNIIVLRNTLFLQITVGRSTHDHTVDVDLSLEGPAWKVSRRQGTIRLRNNGDFFLSSEGKRAIYVDGRPILAGNKYRLNNNSVVEASLR